MGLVTKPRISDEWEPTNEGLWNRVTRMAQGEIKELRSGKKTYHAPRDGAGFAEWPSPRATGWCVRIYNLMGGRWREKGELKEAHLTGIRRRVASRHATKLAKMLGEDIHRKMAAYREGPDRDWKSCAGCAFWVATAPVSEARREGRCLRYAFEACSLGACPSHVEI